MDTTDTPVYVDGIGQPLQDVRQDYAYLVQHPETRIGIQAAADVVALIDAYLALLASHSR
jgi:hypothetical protein